MSGSLADAIPAMSEDREAQSPFHFFNRPGRREAAKGGHLLTKSPKFIDRPADDDRTNERIEKYGDPSASNHVASSDAKYSTDYSRDL